VARPAEKAALKEPCFWVMENLPMRVVPSAVAVPEARTVWWLAEPWKENLPLELMEPAHSVDVVEDDGASVDFVGAGLGDEVDFQDAGGVGFGVGVVAGVDADDERWGDGMGTMGRRWNCDGGGGEELSGFEGFEDRTQVGSDFRGHGSSGG
jgi:hypothetical protein